MSRSHSDHFDRERLDAFVADGWLRCQRHPDADLWIYNYTEKTQFENHWTPETINCRGLILDADGAVVARPFPKFFNYGTQQAVVPVEPFTVTEKIDGSLGILYALDGEYRIATRGSFTSEQAQQGTWMLEMYEIDPTPGTTPLFEIVYPANRIVVDYGQRRELVLLAALDNATARDVPLPAFSGPVVERYDHADIEALAALEKPNSEGFVVTFESGVRVKVKFAEYVRLHRIVTGVNAKTIWEALRNGDDFDALLDGIPDEIYAWIQATRAGLNEAYAELEDACRAALADCPDADRKTQAEYILGCGANSAVLFRMLDGKPYEDFIWKAIRPEATTPTGLVVTDAE